MLVAVSAREVDQMGLDAFDGSLQKPIKPPLLEDLLRKFRKQMRKQSSGA
jgi:hypothetical protein